MMTYNLVWLNKIGFIWLNVFLEPAYVATVCLLSKLNTEQHIEAEVKMDELDATAAKAIYDESKAYRCRRIKVVLNLEGAFS